MMREQKARVKLVGSQGGQKYSEYFVVSATCADGATHKVADHARLRMRTINGVTVTFVDWLAMNDKTPVNF